MAFPLRLGLMCVLLLAIGSAQADENHPALKLSQRYRVALKDGAYEARMKEVVWQPSQTAIIVCDMWDAHHCLNAVRRLEEMAPVMNQVLDKARKEGVLIVHAPSSCMATYADHPARKRAQAAPMAKNLSPALVEFPFWKVSV